MKDSIQCVALVALFSLATMVPSKNLMRQYSSFSVTTTTTTTTNNTWQEQKLQRTSPSSSSSSAVMMMDMTRHDKLLVDSSTKTNATTTRQDTVKEIHGDESFMDEESLKVVSSHDEVRHNASLATFRSNFYRAHPFVNESRRENVFAKALAVNTTFVPVGVASFESSSSSSSSSHHSGQERGKHLHLGALDVNGQPSFVYNVTALRHNPPAFNGTDMDRYCNTSDLAYTVLKRLQILPPVPAHNSTNNNMHNNNTSTSTTNTTNPPIRLLCAVYSAEQYHVVKISAILETWGPKCDGFLVASNATDPAYHAVNILKVGGKERYQNMWNKVQATWGYIYDHYYTEFDWFHLGGDDMWLVVENLRHYLNSNEIYLAQNGGRTHGLPHASLQFPLFLGQTVAYGGKIKMLYNTGGPGYTLNKAALKLLVTEILPLKDSQKQVPFEDRMIATSFSNYAPNPVLPYPTRDDELRHRYNTFAPMRYYKRNIPSWYRMYTKVFHMKYGKEHCSPYAVSFHYLRPWVMRQLHALKYLCPTAEQSDTR